MDGGLLDFLESAFMDVKLKFLAGRMRSGGRGEYLRRLRPRLTAPICKTS